MLAFAATEVVLRLLGVRSWWFALVPFSIMWGLCAPALCPLHGRRNPSQGGSVWSVWDHHGVIMRSSWVVPRPLSPRLRNPFMLCSSRCPTVVRWDSLHAEVNQKLDLPVQVARAWSSLYSQGCCGQRTEAGCVVHCVGWLGSYKVTSGSRLCIGFSLNRFLTPSRLLKPLKTLWKKHHISRLVPICRIFFLHCIISITGNSFSWVVTWRDIAYQCPANSFIRFGCLWKRDFNMVGSWDEIRWWTIMRTLLCSSREVCLTLQLQPMIIFMWLFWLFSRLIYWIVCSIKFQKIQKNAAQFPKAQTDVFKNVFFPVSPKWLDW